MAEHADRRSPSWLQRLLFVDETDPTSLSPPRAHERFVLTALLKRRPGVAPGAFRRQVAVTLAEKLSTRRGELGIESLRVYRDASAGGLLSLFLQLTRSRGYTALLCRVLGRAPPPPFRIRYGVIYDAIVQMAFEEAPAPPGFDAVVQLLRSPGISAAEPVLLGSTRQYTVYDACSDSDERERINICFLVNRPGGMTRETCQAYWHTRHADLALRNMRYLNLTRYLQVHTMPAPAPGCDDTYDGVVYAEKRSLGRLLIELAKPDSFRFNNTVVIDETHFTECTPIMLMRLETAW